MAEKIVSPGVFTNEKDLTFLPEGIAEIGANIIGLFDKGPAFRPTIVESQNDFSNQFGNNNSKLYAPYAAKSYLQNAGRATITRILGETGYLPTGSVGSIGTVALLPDTGSANLGAVLAPTKATYEDGITSVSITSGNAESFILQVSSSNGTEDFSASLNETNKNYVNKVFGTSPNTSNPLYVYSDFTGSFGDLSTLTPGVSSSFSTEPLNFQNVGYANGSTPWIQSQEIGGSAKNLFKVHAISDGNVSNREFKISISSIRTSDEVPGTDTYGTFALEVREFGDTDNRPSVIETFSGLNLNPNSANYIAKRIGDTYTTVTTSTTGDVKVDRVGEYENNSDYIYIEIADGLEELSNDIIPFGFGPYKNPVGGDLDDNTPALTFEKDPIVGGATSSKAYFGVDFTKDNNKEYFAPVPSSASTGSNVAFSLEGSTTSDGTSLTFANISNTNDSDRKFTLGLQGGFDGFNPAKPRLTGENITSTNTQGLDLSSNETDDYALYEKALDIISNGDVYDINMILTPGVLHNYHSAVTNKAIDVAENRADTFYLMDNTRLNDSIQQAIDSVSDLDTSYAGTYYPWTKVRDYDNNKTVWVPPSVTMPAVFAFNDSVAAEWFAPAGLNRGGIDDAIDVATKLAKAERDLLYENRINPIASFTNQGIVAWGQKTLQLEASALDRINVRRLLIDVKKFVASTSKFLVFEQNTAATRNRFLNIVNPYLESIQQRSGLFDFRVKMDEELNSPEVIDRNQLIGQIFLQPTRTAEFIIVDFSLVPTGAVFSE